MSLRAAALALWRRGNLFLSEISLKTRDCFGKNRIAMTREKNFTLGESK